MPNPENLLPPFDSKRGRECQKKSAESRRRNKTIRESMCAALDMPVTDKKQLDMIKKSGLPVPAKPTYKDFLMASALVQTIKNGRMSDIETLMRIVGEDNISNDVSKESAEALNDLVNAIKVARNADNGAINETG